MKTHLRGCVLILLCLMVSCARTKEQCIEGKVQISAMMRGMSYDGTIDSEIVYSLLSGDSSYKLVFAKECEFIGFAEPRQNSGDFPPLPIDSESTYRAWGAITNTQMRMEISYPEAQRKSYDIKEMTVHRFQKIK